MRRQNELVFLLRNKCGESKGIPLQKIEVCCSKQELIIKQIW
jgi:hypothetical protein